jgi:hypothetical protein
MCRHGRGSGRVTCPASTCTVTSGTVSPAPRGAASTGSDSGPATSIVAIAATAYQPVPAAPVCV